MTLESSGDTHVMSGAPNQNAGGDTLLSLRALGTRRVLLFFGAPEIRAAIGTGTLLSARVELTVGTAGTNWGASGRPIAIHRLAKASAEYGATWACAVDANLNNFQADCSGATAWSMDVTDPAAQPWVSPATASATITNGRDGVVSFSVTADVSALLAGTDTGDGWLIKKVNENLGGAIEFASREQGPAPRLVLDVEGAPTGGGTIGPVTGSATIPPDRDSNVRHLSPNQNFGAEDPLRIQALGKNRALIGFDAPAVTATLDGQLVKARLRLPIATTLDNWGPDRALGVHRMRASWTEPGATWNCAVDANTSDFAANCTGNTAWMMSGSTEERPWLTSPTDTVLVSNGQTGTLEFDVTRDVACALAGHAPLQGWLVKKAMESQSGRIDLRSRESAQAPSLFLEWTDGNGIVVSAADCAVAPPPGGCTPSASEDTTCNGIDEDCDGLADDDFVVTDTSCGVGACGASGQVSCVSGQLVDNCSPGAPGADDASCNGLDDDCDSIVDEEYTPSSTSCGVGACGATGQTSCVLGDVVDSCQPGTPAAADPTCNGQDDDCDGITDEDYAGILTSCGTGGCSASAATTCEQGHVVDHCQPGTPATADSICNGIDDDCDGSVDEEVSPSCAGTLVRTCSGGVIQQTNCSDGNVCNGQEVCVGAGLCQSGAAPTPDDQNPCTADACDPISGIQHSPVPAGVECAGADTCAGTGHCDGAGSCVGAEPPDDGNPCTEAACEPATGEVVHLPLAEGTECRVDACSTGTCDAAGVCQPRAAPDDDGDPCTLAVCDPVTGQTQVSCAPLDRTVITTVKDSMAWLYTGATPLQTGLNPDTIELQRAAVLRGEVLDRDGVALSGVRVRIAHHPEFGETVSQIDGRFDMVVNGGGLLTVDFQHEGYLNAQRQLNVPWNEFSVVPEVALVRADSVVTQLDLTQTAQPFQVAQGSVVNDDDGTRQATLLVPRGTQALMHRTDGSVEPLQQLSIRATEFTVGPNGEAAMPAPLPPTSGYTYAVEFNADEAVAAGAPSIEFDQPLVAYVDNFLEFPAGTVVPVGAYDRQLNRWVPHESGVVVDIIGVGPGGASVDVTGDGVADTGAIVATHGITADELLTLASLRFAGDSVWRIEVPHFTQPYDCNWPISPPGGASGPPPPPGGSGPGGGGGGPGGGGPGGGGPGGGGSGDDNADDDDDASGPEVDDPCEEDGSIIECQNLVLRERVQLAGTEYSLNYASDRMPDRQDRLDFHVPISGATVPASLKRIDLTIDVLGRRYAQSFPPVPGQSYHFQWDGVDAYGRKPQGLVPATVTTSFVYDGVYGRTTRFGDYGSGVQITGDRARGELFLSNTWTSPAIGTLDTTAEQLGGWTLSAHHTYDARSQVLYLGDGTTRRMAAQGAAIVTNVARTPDTGADAYVGDVGPDGRIYFSDGRRVFWTKDGVVQRIAGGAQLGNTGDDGPATSARMQGGMGLALHLDGLLIADTLNNRIRRVDAAGIIKAFAGTGVAGFSGDDGPAIQAQFRQPRGLDVGPDGSIYVADFGNHRIRRIDTSGIVTTVAGNGQTFPLQDGVLATQVAMNNPWDVAAAPDGTLYIATSTGNTLYAVERSGIIRKLITNLSGTGGFQDGQSASTASMTSFNSVDVDREGTVYFGARFNPGVPPIGLMSAIFGLTPSGTVFGVAGPAGGQPTPQMPPYRSGAAAKSFYLTRPEVVVGPNGVFGSDRETVQNPGFVFQVRPAAPGLAVGEVRVPNPGAEEVYAFLGSRHTKTLHARTGAVLQEFVYAGGELTSVRNAHGLVTTIERDAAGRVTAIVGPYGQRTRLATDDAGFLSRIENPMGDAMSLASTNKGLLTSIIDARGNETTVTYDALGRVSGEAHADGGEVSYTPSGSLTRWNVDFVSAEGRSTRYEVDKEAGVDVRRVTAPDGNTSATRQNKSAAVADVARPDGSELAQVVVNHARFGLAKPQRATTTVLPSGLTRAETLTHTVSGLSATDPFSYTTEVKTRLVNGRQWRETYARSTNTLTLLSPAGRSSATIFDSFGRPLQRQAPGILPIIYGYDDDGRLETITQGTRTQRFAYFDTSDVRNGYLKSKTNALLQATESTPDAMGRVISQVAPDGSETLFGWDANGNLTSVAPPGRPAHHQTFSTVDLPSSYSPPGQPGGTLSEFNLDRQPTLATHADGLTLERVYDADGKMDFIQTAEGPIDYTYFGSGTCPGCSFGAISSISDPGGVNLSFTYDGSLTTGTAWSGAVSGAINWSYDSDFRVRTETVTAGTTSGSAVFAYDADNLLVCASPTSCSPASADALVIQNDSAQPRANGSTLGIVSDDYDYNAYGELAAYRVLAGGATIFSEIMDTAAHPRDPLGRVAFESEFNGSATSDYEYRYDLQGRLEQVITDGVTTHFLTYDPNGNRSSLETPADAFSATYDDQDRLLTYGSWAYTYTDHGDLLTKVNSDTGAAWAYQYDVRGNLVRVDLPDGSVIEYVVDGQNRRVGKKVDGVLVRQWLWRDRLSIAAELDGSGNMVSRFVYGNRPTTPEFVIRAGTTYRVISDHLASVRALINVANAGDIPVTLDYDVFGEVSGTGLGVIPQGFAGGLYDPDTGLIRFGARDYDSAIGRWVQRDPVLFAGGANNLYAYAGCDPINASDANGLLCNPLQIYNDATRAADNSGLGGAWNGPQDAYRHCVASCMATRDCGAHAAAALGIINEAWHQNPDEERMMDHHNNQCGIYLGEESSGSCEDECRNALYTYGLQFEPNDEEYYSSAANSY